MTSEESSEDFAAVATFNTLHDAELAQSRLEDTGIQSFISRDDAGGAHPELQLTQGVRLMVDGGQVDDARQVLEEIDAVPTGVGSEIEEHLYEAQQRKMWRDLGMAFLWIGVLVVIGVVLGWYITGTFALVVGVGGCLAVLAGWVLRSKGARQEPDR